jgi:hypothetical protein
VGGSFETLHTDSLTAADTAPICWSANELIASNSNQLEVVGYTHIDVMEWFTGTIPTAGALEITILGKRDDDEVWQLLKDADGNRTITFTYGATTSECPQDDASANFLSDPVHVDLRGCKYITCGVRVKSDAGGTSKVVCGLC